MKFACSTYYYLRIAHVYVMLVGSDIAYWPHISVHYPSWGSRKSKNNLRAHIVDENLRQAVSYQKSKELE